MVENQQPGFHELERIIIPSQYQKLSVDSEIYVYQNNSGVLIGFRVHRGLQASSTL